MEFYPEKDRWLFGGAYPVPKHTRTKKGIEYEEVEPLDESKPFIGRLKLQFTRRGRGKAHYFEKHYDKLIVSEILPERYTGERFCGFDQIDLPFEKLEQIVRQQREDWKAALENAKGVYLISDTRNGKRYVGSAYGDSGIWSRWEYYIGTGHGDSDELKRLISKRGISYARRFFRFSLLEYFSMKTNNEFVSGREAYWKTVLLSRGRYGYNKN